MTPTDPSERLQALDVLRGFALLGILFVNLNYWFRTYPGAARLEPDRWSGLPDRAAELLIATFFNARFLTLFSMLFGAGLALQLERVDARGGRVYRFAARRLAGLFLFGVAHVALLWMGDILHLYALVGLLYLLFLRRKTRTLTIWLGALLALPVLVTLGVLAVKGLARPPQSTQDLEPLRQQAAAALQAYGQPGWLAVARHRLHDYLATAGMLPVEAYAALIAFLTGLLAWRSGIVQRPTEHLPALRRTLALGLAFGLAQTALARALRHLLPPSLMGLSNLAFSLAFAASLAMALAYAAGILLLLQRPAWPARLTPLAAAGRMALTNYLMQSLICGFIFHGYGLGLYDRLGPATGALITLGIYASQVLVSAWWLRHHRFGPVEWLWRAMTYGRSQPMRA